MSKIDPCTYSFYKFLKPTCQFHTLLSIFHITADITALPCSHAYPANLYFTRYVITYEFFFSVAKANIVLPFEPSSTRTIVRVFRIA